MKSRYFLWLAGLALGIATTLSAQTDQDFQTWMKAANAACGRIKKNVDAKANAADIQKDAKEFAANFKKMQGFWKKRKADDAVQLSVTAQTAAKAVAKAAKSGNMDEAATQFKAMTGTCGGCHKAHRDKNPDGSFKIK